MRFNGKNIPAYMRNALKWIPLEGKKAYIEEWQKQGNRFETIANTANAAAGAVLDGTVMVLDFHQTFTNDNDLTAGTKKMAGILKKLSPKGYTELSISGTGVHLCYKVTPNNDIPPRFSIPLGKSDNGENVLNIYHGDSYYMAMTGNICGEDKDLPDGDKVRAYLWETCQAVKARMEKKATAAAPDPKPKSDQQDGPNVKHTTQNAKNEYINPNIVIEPEWPVMIKNGKGKMIPAKTWENTAYCLSQLGIGCKFNTLSKQIELTGSGLDDLTFDSAVTSARSWLLQNGLPILKTEAIDHLARWAEKNQYNPVQAYLTKCGEEWFGDDVIEKLFDCLKIQPAYAANRDFYLQLFFKWLVGAARIAFNDGSYNMEGILVLQGPQGIGKTRFLYKLVPDRAWALEGVHIDPKDKDDLLKVCGRWLVELGEFAETLKKDTKDRLKQFFTQSVDVLRKPYDRGVVTLPRNTAFIGTINNEEFLTDPTGERRYWVIPVEAIEGTENIDISQVWGQVMQFVEMGAPSWLNAEEIAKINIINEPFKKRSSIEIAILDLLAWDTPVEYWRQVTSTDLCKELGFPVNQSGRVGRVLKTMMDNDERIEFKRTATNRIYLLPKLLENTSYIGDSSDSKVT